MADIRPFAAFRPAPDLARRVASPPYDVLSSDEARVLAADEPLSFLHVNKAEIDLERGASEQEIHDRSAANLQRMIDEGVLIQDAAPAFYVYALTMDGRVQYGLAAGCSVDEVENGIIKKHEHTRRDKEDDRARHMQRLGVNVGPVLFTYRADRTVRNIVERVRAAEPDVDFTAVDGVGHTLWMVSDPSDVKALQDAFAQIPALYVADGHHRTAAACRTRAFFRDRNPEHTGDEPYNFFLAVLFPDDELRLMGYHRVVADLNGLSPADFLAAVAEVMDVEPTDAPEPQDHHRWGMYLEGRWHRVSARPGTFPADDPVRSLDAAVLQELVLEPILGIGDPRQDPRIDFVGGSRGAAELERRCREDMAVAFAFAPASVDQIMAVADAEAVMPPKSTWFEPKLRSGLLVRSLTD